MKSWLIVFGMIVLLLNGLVLSGKGSDDFSFIEEEFSFSPPTSKQVPFENNNNIVVEWKKEWGWLCKLKYLDEEFPCALGANGVVPAASKVEGDGCTPAGVYALRQGFYRYDRVGKLQLPSSFQFNMTVTQPNFGWCDAPTNAYYNQFVYLPFPASHENLWLNGTDYDILTVIGYNDQPVVPYRGSAIFFHVSPHYAPTAGCVAIALPHLQWVLANLQQQTMIDIQILSSSQ